MSKTNGILLENIILADIVSDCYLRGGEVHRVPDHEVPRGFPRIAVEARYQNTVELYVILDLEKAERPYVELLKGFLSLHHVQEKLQSHGEKRRILTHVHGAHSDVTNWAELMRDKEFMALCDLYFPQSAESKYKMPADAIPAK